MTPLRVGIDARVVPGAFGGVEQFTLGLGHALSHLPDGDEEYLFLVNPGQAEWLLPHAGPRGSLVEAATSLGDNLPSSTSAMRRLLRHAVGRLPAVRDAWRRVRDTVIDRGPPPIPCSDGVFEAANVDVVHFPTQSGFLTRIPSIYQPWDLQHLHFPQFFSRSARRKREAQYRTFCAQATVVVVASRWARDDIAERYGLPLSKFRVVPVPPVVEFYPTPSQADLATTRARLGLPTDFLYYPAQAWPHKNHGRLLRALAGVRDRGRAIPLVCSGSPNEHSTRVEAEARRLGLSDSFFQVGYVSPLEVQCLYRLARAVVFPSLFEGWGMPVLEAYAAGTPVACSNASSLREAAGDGALLFDPLDEASIQESIERLWSDPGLREELKRSGTRMVRQMRWEDTARAYRHLYRVLAKGETGEDEPRPANVGQCPPGAHAGAAGRQA